MDEIIEEAATVHRKYGSDDLDYVAEKLGAEIHEDLRAASAKEVYFPDLRAILIRPSLPRHERRFLIGHALGHHLFHSSSNHPQARIQEEYMCGNLQLGKIEVPRSEKEADMFAGYLLVPEVKLRPVLRQNWTKESDDPVLALALEFQVPVELMRERLVFEGLRN